MTSYAKDFIERVVATFAFTFLSVFSFTDLSTSRGAVIAGAAAAATVVKSWLGGFIGNDEHAGLTS